MPRRSDPEPTAPPAPNYSWYEGSAGYVQAYEEASQTRQPILVYFYTDWCPHCRTLDRELLRDAAVEEYTSGLIKVRINPEQGATENEIANRYGISGYPTVFVHRRGLGRPRSIDRQIWTGDEWRLRTPEEFISELRSAAG